MKRIGVKCLFAQDAENGSSHQSVPCNVSENNAVISIFEQIFIILKKHQNRKNKVKLWRMRAENGL